MLTDKPTEKRPLGWFRYRWEENIRMDYKEIDINTRKVRFRIWIIGGYRTSGFHKPWG